jgi:hypothetical protein
MNHYKSTAHSQNVAPMNISNPMLDAKSTRKRAEVDLQLLANRVALLKAEEAKSLAKIHVTKTRAKNVVEVKKRNESSGNERYATQMKREEDVRKARIRAQEERERRKKRLEHTRLLVSEGKMKVAAEKKKDLEDRLEERKKQLLIEEVEKRQKAEEQRRRHHMIQVKAAKEKETKELETQAMYAKKLEEEILRANEAESLIAQLEAEEAEMIERLRKVHENQQSAYGTLKASLDC